MKAKSEKKRKNTVCALRQMAGGEIIKPSDANTEKDKENKTHNDQQTQKTLKFSKIENNKMHK